MRTMSLLLPVLAFAAAFASACGDGEPRAPTTAVPAKVVNGLFTEPMPTPPDEVRPLGQKPWPIAVWNGTSTLLLDAVAKTSRDLGPGSPGQFRPDGTRMAWVRGERPLEGGEVIVVDLATGAETPHGPGRLVAFVDDTTLGIVRPGQNVTEHVDLTTGMITTEGRITILQLATEVTTPDGYILRKELVSDHPVRTNRFSLVDPVRNEELLTFEALQAAPAGNNWLAVATVPVPSGGAPDLAGNVPQTTNIFLVHVSSGLATFVATSPTAGRNWPLIANDAFVAWTDDYCPVPPGKTRIFDRSSGRITETDATLWLNEFTPDGMIAAGPFGADELIDPGTLEYAVVIPPSEATWSPDYRYASVGQVGGHGGLCP